MLHAQNFITLDPYSWFPTLSIWYPPPLLLMVYFVCHVTCAYVCVPSLLLPQP